jgi:hypothetical protein
MTMILNLSLSIRQRIALLVLAVIALLAGAARKLRDEFEEAIGTKRARMALSVRSTPYGPDSRRTFGRGLFAPGPMLTLVAAKTGTLSVADLRAVQFQSAVAFGMDTIAEVFARDLAVHQAIMNDMLAPLANVTKDRQRKYGTSDRGRMTPADEFTRAPTKKAAGGATVGFPLNAYQYALGWTYKYLQNHTPAELADQLTVAKKAQAIEVQQQIKKAIFLSANYTHNDHLVDNVDLAVKRFVNADSASIPDGPNGEEYDGATHTHYDAINGLTAAALKALIRDVVEHGHGGKVVVVINVADEATVSALTGFKAYTDPRLVVGNTDGTTTGRLDITRLDNRAIGIFDAAEVWVKPWGLANYAFAYDQTTTDKPLVVRTRTGAAPSLELVAEISTFPLQAQYFESEFGVGVWTRTNGAVLYFGGGAYTDPTIT